MINKELETIEARFSGKIDFINPFPGLRPFSFEESHLFFGREGQSDEVLLNLAKHRFTAVIGASGSGKSSLMNCGLIPILYGGFMTSAGSDWNVFVARPGLNPIENLAQEILNQDETYLNSSEEEQSIGRTITSTILRSSSMGLVDAVKQMTKSAKRNVFLLIDQFEELFRYMKAGREKQESEAVNEAAAFVNLLIKSVSQTEVPIYIALTMRSDFIGECSQFPELTHIINKSHYLIPQMTREQQRLAIEGPIAVGGAKISKRLVQQVLNDVGNNPDQLPVMQHALMRTWDYWVKNREVDEPIDLRHYIAVGKISEALSQHANEAYSELTKNEKVICEVLFKGLTEKGADNQGVRRNKSLKDIAEIAEVSEDDVINVIDKFREPGRSLLMPAANVHLNSNSIIEISHESLMRIWQRLKNWVDEEAESANMYRRLSDAAAMYQVGKTGLWRPPDLQLALNWQMKQKPTRTWAKRYNPAFERAIVFLETSKGAYENEQRSKELLQKRMLNRTRYVAIILGILAVIAILFFVFGWIKKVDADRQREIAELNKEEAEKNAAIAEEKRKEAEQQKLYAIQQQQEAILQKNRAIQSEDEALKQKNIAETQTNYANEQRFVAETEKVRADSLRIIAVQQGKIAMTERDNAFRLRMLSIAQSMAVKSLTVPDLDLKTLLAYQAYLFNEQYGGKVYDNFIYDGLYYAKRDKVNATTGKEFNVFRGHSDMIRSMVVNKKGNTLFTTGSDGKVLKWDLKTYKYQVLWQPAGHYVNYVMRLSPDEKWLIIGGDAPYILEINLENLETVKLPGHQGPVTEILFLPNSDYYLSLGINDSTLRINDFANSSVMKKFDSRITALAMSPDGNMLLGGNEKGEVFEWDSKNLDNEKKITNITDRPIYAIQFNPKGDKVAIGNEDGVVYMCNVRNHEIQVNTALRGQNSRINKIEFSRDGDLLATASLDGTIQMWVMDRMDKMLPLAFKDHKDYVWSIKYTPDGNYLLAGTKDGELKVWPTRPGLMADDICKYLLRDMTAKEWERYVGEDIKFEKTCQTVGGAGKPGE